MKGKRERNPFAVTRREFGKHVAALGTAAVVLPANAGAGATEPRLAGSAGHLAAQNPPDAPPQHLSAEGRVRFESMWQNVLRKHGSRLTAEQKTRMRKIVANNVTMLEAVYAVPVKNGDAPATTLHLVETAASGSRAMTHRPPRAGATAPTHKSQGKED